MIYVYVDLDRVTGYSDNEEPNTIPFDATEDFLNNPFKYKYVNGEFIVDADKERIMGARRDNREHQTLLDNTDWKVMRHRDQVDLGVVTSLTSEEYIALLQARQEAREAIINK